MSFCSSSPVRVPIRHLYPSSGQVVAGEHNVGELENVQADMPMLQPKMKKRHLNMIAVGGSIGTGLFVGSGSALHNGGPAGVIISYIIIGAMLVNVTQVGFFFLDK